MKALFEEIIIELSYNCNLSCRMCGFGKHVNPFHKSKFLPFERYRDILRQLGPLCKTVRLNGRGESTIHPDFTEILYYTKDAYPGLRINLFSNLSFRNERIIQGLLDAEVQLFVSLDSSDPPELETIRAGAKFHFIQSNLERMRTTDRRPFIVFTIQEENLHRIYDIAKLARQYQCHIIYNTVRRDEGMEDFLSAVHVNRETIAIQFEKVRQLFGDSNLLAIYPDQLAGIDLNLAASTQTNGTRDRCPALEKELCVLYDGTVTPCNMFHPYVYGNLFQQDLEEIWRGERRQTFLQTHKAHAYCQNCANLGG